MKNEMVMDQLILFHKPNKKVRSEKKMNNFIPQTKHTLLLWATSSKRHQNLDNVVGSSIYIFSSSIYLNTLNNWFSKIKIIGDHN
jgi:hypothetical protein